MHKKIPHGHLIFFSIVLVVFTFLVIFNPFLSPLKKKFFVNVERDSANQESISNKEKSLQNKDIEKELALQDQVDKIIFDGELEACDKVDDDYYKRVCVNNVAYEMAKKTGDVSYCKKLDDILVSVEDCEWNVVLNKSLLGNDVTICEEAENQDLRAQCLENFYSNKALKEGEVENCEQINEIIRRNNCIDSFVFENEFLSDISNFECEKFSDKQARNDCALLNEEENIFTKEVCMFFSSNLFVDYCLVNNF
ncbi:hypothetical protein C0584_04295 [Candidatus Parcubacteria bacterium]|nr:MAG: hypothetical protein C0584_04295 [Candidatus Parcubacteria bacterium]